MNARSAGSRLALLAFVVALLLKGAVPLFASWSAHLQGKGVAEVCDVYGVALPARTDPAMHAKHGMHAMHGMPAAPAEAPHRHEPGSHSGDHCVLGALVAFASGGSDAAALAPATRCALLHALAWSADPIGVDASARWAARLGHGPPDFS